mgnify:CR=1 FL=1
MDVVLVGHCTPDAFMLKSMVERVLPDSTVHVVNDDESLANHLDENVTWLVNRVLDGVFTVGQAGMELIESRVNAVPDAKILLISDLAEHQEAAERMGARPGFGKKGLYDDEAATRLHNAVEG